jgi:hypothetical protein
MSYHIDWSDRIFHKLFNLYNSNISIIGVILFRILLNTKQLRNKPETNELISQIGWKISKRDQPLVNDDAVPNNQ